MDQINVVDFTEYPGLRHCEISDDSGEEFYHAVLNGAFYKAISNEKDLTVNLDGTAGYAPSFIDEAFGNLVYDFGLEIVKKHLEIVSEEEPDWKDMLYNETFPQWESRRIEGKKPKVTQEHTPWYRVSGSNIEKGQWS